MPSRRTSSLNRSRSGSISSKPSSAGKPPTLWWCLIVAAGPSRSPPALDHVGVERALRQKAAPWRSTAPHRRNTSMNVWPIRMRFSCGSVTPAQGVQETARWRRRRAARPRSAGRSVSATAVARPRGAGRCRRRCRRPAVPSARASSAAATAESTPPETPQTTRSLGRPALQIARPSRSMKRAHRPGAARSADPVEEVAQNQRAIRRVRHLGVELQAVDRPRAVLHRRDRAGCRWRPAAAKSGPASCDLVAVDHPDVRRVGYAVQERSRSASTTRHSARPYSRAGGGFDLPAQRAAGQLHAVADAEHRHAELEQARVALRGAGSYTLDGPPERISASGSSSRTRSAVTSCRTIRANVCCSRTRRAMSWTYCEPKSRTSTGRSDGA